MYRWRKLSPDQREETLRQRKFQRHPWHSPPHTKDSKGLHLVTATCYEHRPWIGQPNGRMDEFSSDLLTTLKSETARIDAWVVLPNHYHAVVLTESIPALLRVLGRLHGRCSFRWNREDSTTGRKVWFNTLERVISDEAHHFTAIQYVHHNPVKHGHTKRWSEWKWSSAATYLETIGREEAERRWREYPVTNYGDGWDD